MEGGEAGLFFLTKHFPLPSHEHRNKQEDKANSKTRQNFQIKPLRYRRASQQINNNEVS